MHLYPNAKINIGLHVVEKRPDGYHNIETVFYPIGLKDELVISKAIDLQDADCHLEVRNASFDGSPEDNLVVKAYRLLQRDFNLGAIDIRLIKNIPSGSGLGGGSADAAFTLKALNEIFELQLDDDVLERYAARLGADCPVFIKNKPVYATGIGDVFTPIDFSLSGFTLVVIVPDIHISTPEAYAAMAPRYPKQNILDSIRQPVENWKNIIYNDFETFVFNKHPELRYAKDKLYDLGASYASMSGSGSAIYGLFKGFKPASATFDKYRVFVESF